MEKGLGHLSLLLLNFVFHLAFTGDTRETSQALANGQVRVLLSTWIWLPNNSFNLSKLDLNLSVNYLTLTSQNSSLSLLINKFKLKLHVKKIWKKIYSSLYCCFIYSKSSVLIWHICVRFPLCQWLLTDLVLSLNEWHVSISFHKNDLTLLEIIWIYCIYMHTWVLLAGDINIMS